MIAKGNWSLVTGASSGLGVEFAKGLAKRGSNLVLVARRAAPMEHLAAQLRKEHAIQVIVEATDLGETDSAIRLQSRLEQRGVNVDILVNNAAFGLAERFLDHEPARLREMLQLDIVATSELTYVFGKRMVHRCRGKILLVASLAAYQPSPLLAAYGAAKAYVLSFGEALNLELAPNVGVTVLSPGLMDTEFNAVSGYETSSAMQRTALSPETVAKIGLDAMFAGKSGVIAGRMNAIMAFSTRFMSRHFQAKTVFRLSGG